MIHGNKWLILESKHRFTPRLLKLFDDKCEFIKRHAKEKWVNKKYDIPTEVVKVACSITDFADDSSEISIVRIVRDGLAYKIK